MLNNYEIERIASRNDWPVEAIRTFLEYGACSNDEDKYTLENEFRDAYEGEYDSEKDFAEDLMETTGDINLIPECYQYYFDYEAYARDLFIDDYWSAKSSNYTIYVFRRI